jgi:hypothetical protein
VVWAASSQLLSELPTSSTISPMDETHENKITLKHATVAYKIGLNISYTKKKMDK